MSSKARVRFHAGCVLGFAVSGCCGSRPFDHLLNEDSHAFQRASFIIRDYFNYFDRAFFASDAAFVEYVRELRRKSLFDIPVDVKAGDALLTLSTCIDDDRLVVVARRMRTEETKDQLISAIEASV